MAVPAPGERRGSPAPFRAGALIVLFAVLGGRSRLLAQDDYYPTKQPTFRIPFQIDPGDRRVVQVILHVSEDLGKTYQQVTTASPGDKGFTFTARHDGWYYFTVQTMDNERRLHPANLDGAQPGLRVLVKTVPPSIKLRPLNNLARGQVGVEWDIRDEALEVNSLRLEYRTAGQLWQDRPIQKVAFGQDKWEPNITGAVEVRMQVRDRAGNLGEATERLTVGGGMQMDHADDPPGGGGNRQQNPDPTAIRKINSTRISLNFKVEDVGPSDVSAIEVWKTKDGRTWQKLPKDADRKPPIVFEVEGEGRYGITLIAKSGVGLGEPPPRPGDTPQIWLEVDLTKPEVSITDVVVGRGPDSGSMTITWTARDANLARQPITLLYATKSEGPWLPIVKNIENTGRYVWRMQTDVPFEFFVRVEAVDEAGNVGQADTRTSVKVDLALPKARVIGIDGIKAEPAPGGYTAPPHP
jgi:hypothetical protein